MDNQYKDFLSIVAFLVAVLVIDIAFGHKPTYYFLILVLLGVLVKNYDKFKIS